MERRLLGHTDLAITPIGLGAWAIGGGDWCYGWGPQSDEHSFATIRRAISLGLNWIDTSGVYGLGRSETLIARALRGVPQSDRPYVFTKCGFVWDELGNVSASLAPDAIRREAEASLRRLGIDAIDLYQIDADCRHTSRSASIEEAWETLAALKREGKVRHIGIARCHPQDLSLLERIAPVASVQMPYSLLRREVEGDVLPYCAARGIGVLASSTMESGLLTGAMTPARLRTLPHNDWRRCSPSFRGETIARVQQIVDRLRGIGARHGVAPAAVAIAWTLRRQTITAAVAGARRPQQVDEIAAAASVRLSANEIEEIETGNPVGSEVPGVLKF